MAVAYITGQAMSAALGSGSSSQRLFSAAARSGRISITGTGEVRTTLSATLPTMVRSNAPLPWVAMTIKSAPSSAAAAGIACAGSVSTTSVRTAPSASSR